MFCVSPISSLFLGVCVTSPVWLHPLSPESDPVLAALLIIFLLVLPLVLLVIVLRLPRVRRQLSFIRANSLIHKGRQNR